MSSQGEKSKLGLAWNVYFLNGNKVPKSNINSIYKYLFNQVNSNAMHFGIQYI